MYDVIVAGGGPVGSYVASKLAQMGHTVLVLEKREGLSGLVCCTGIISQECLDYFAIDSNVVLRKANSARIFSPSDKQIRLWRSENQVCIVDRVAFDLAIVNRAKAAGAEYLLGTRVRNIESDDDRLLVEATHNGQKLGFAAKAAVIAAGSGSKLTEKSGLGKNRDLILGAQAEVERKGIDEIEVYLGREVAPGFFAWLVPISSGRALVGLLTRHNPGLYLKRLLSRLKVQGKIVSEKVEVSYRSILLRPPAKTCTRRLITVGGAAGQVKPTTGGGIYFGMLCAEMTAGSLHRALEENDLTSDSLSSYEREWKRKLGKELKVGYRARTLYERLNDRQIDRVFDIMLNNGFVEVLLEEDEVSFDWHSRAILRLTQQKLLTKALTAMKVPLQLIGIRDGQH